MVITVASFAAAVLVLIVVGVVVGGSGTTRTARTTPSPSPSQSPETTTDAASAAPSSVAAAPAATVKDYGLTGVGATDTWWNRHHREDPGFAPGSAYDPDPAYGDPGDERFNTRFYAVDHGDGRIFGFSLRYPRATDLQLALAFDQNLLPRDVREVWRSRQPTCLQIQYVSRTLSRTGMQGILVSYYSDELGGAFTSRKVVTSIVMEGLNAKADSTC
jgi:hypothetical protein